MDSLQKAGLFSAIMAALAIKIAFFIPTPDGMTLVKVPPRSANGRTLRLPGKGASKPGKGSDRGHLFLHLEALMPNGAEPELEELARKFEGFYTEGEPRAGLRWEAKP